MPAIILEVAHPTLGTRLIELLEDGQFAALKLDGEVLPYYPGGPPRPEALVFGSGGDASWFHTLGEQTLEHRELRPQLPEHNGTRAEKGQLTGGDVLRWYAYQLTARVPRQPSQAEWAMVEAARSNDSALLVYADWLESRGELEHAEWTRLSLQTTDAAKARMAELAKRVGTDFRALVARGPVERCFKNCGRRWENLPLHNVPWSRSCRECSQVTWCADSQAVRSLRLFGPVTLDPVTPRGPGDLRPPPRPVG